MASLKALICCSIADSLRNWRNGISLGMCSVAKDRVEPTDIVMPLHPLLEYGMADGVVSPFALLCLCLDFNVDLPEDFDRG